MSPLEQVINDLEHGIITLDDSVLILLKMPIKACPLDAKESRKGTWGEVDDLLNAQKLSFVNYRKLDNKYHEATHNGFFSIVGNSYGYRDSNEGIIEEDDEAQPTEEVREVQESEEPQ